MSQRQPGPLRLVRGKDATPPPGQPAPPAAPAPPASLAVPAAPAAPPTPGNAVAGDATGPGAAGADRAAGPSATGPGPSTVVDQVQPPAGAAATVAAPAAGAPAAGLPDPAGPGGAGRAAAARPEADPDRPAGVAQPRAGWAVAGGALCLLAVIAIGFVADLLLLGALRHNRDQQTSYADFRYALANGTAPVGQADPDGALYPLGTPVALLDVPQIGLREVVLEGTTAGVLHGGPGHLRDTPLPGQVGTSVIMGRREAYGGPFRHLDELRAGDTFTVTTGQGEQTYRVIGLRRAGDPQAPALAGGQGRLTLTTTDGSSLLPNGVLRVDADLTSGAQPTPARVLDRSATPPAEQPMGTDRSVWIPLVFWAQGLLLVVVAITWARARWGRWQAWIVGVPVLAALGLAVADQAAGLLPNLI